MSSLERAIAIAADAHAGRVDKSGNPYVLHAIRVMLAFEDAESRIVAVLHDVIEDHADKWPWSRISAEGFSETVLTALRAITQEPKEDYYAYLERVMQNGIALKVKIADTRDNLDLNKIAELSERDFERLKKYKSVLQLLKKRL